jgi:UDP-N-acetylglucosamine--N-acetylmuramyl-(pentapeptide) pyrophosphoryl-undecaprenol N-acetylglucosamine transferase
MLCRSGAITVAETTALGVPAVYVPYPFSNQEQKRNALPVVEAGGGVLVDNDELTPEWIEQNVIPLARDRQRLAVMGQSAARYGRRDGDEALLEFVLEAVAKNR